ncbi:MAG: MBL fold metallo-hydrolase [Rhizobiales bacterium]|nr:MBL fold metallo-hydrolase [Hyphomicrobiales bacterium]
MSTFKAAIVPVTPFQQNCSLIWDGTSGRGIVVDPGGDVDRILEAVKEAGMTIDHILLTHGHVDHASGADELRERTGAPILGPDERDRFLLEGLAGTAAGYGIAGARNVVPDRFLVEGESIETAGMTFDVLHCPGHTPGHVVFVEKSARFALVGDVLFQGSIGRTDFPYGDTSALIGSIREKLWPLGDDIVFICGHGPTSSFGRERQSNPYVGDGARPPGR